MNSKYLKSLQDLALPRLCVCCGTPLLLQERVLCAKCWINLPLTHLEGLSRNPMADKYNERIEADRYQYAISLFYYQDGSEYTKITQALKYRRHFEAGRLFAGILTEKIRNAGQFKDADLIIPVPLHPLRRWKRGYNQAAVIASVLSHELGIPIDKRTLRRIRWTTSQTKKTKEQKASNIKGAFKAVGHIEARHILLVDDVFTSGSTLAECHRALRKVCSEECRISAVTLACVGG